MVDFLGLTILLPLLGAVVLLFFGKRIGEPWSGWVATATVATSFAIAAGAGLDFFRGGGEAETVMLWEWIPALGLDIELLWDPLSAMMTLVVTGVGSLIHLYSIGYMHGDERYGRYFSYLNLFAASMLILVLAANFGLLFVGWELVGLCSFLLISFWFEKRSAAAAGKKAFIVNRIGDVGFMIALMIIFAQFGTFSFGIVFEEAPAVLTTGAATAIGLLLLVGAIGKSAQLPLYVWLPDAMEGPTPVSALIHAATMVTAGVYLVARSAVIYELSDVAAATVATIGAITLLFAATVAVAQRDIKRVLAWSTISQLGYMFLAVGSGAYIAGMFHLMTHAFFKALLFLGAGSVIHAMKGEQDMRKMGGLWMVMPITFGTMVVGSLALAGVPPFSGFWSKDEILALTYDNGGWYVLLWAMGVVAALLTAFYVGRMMFLTFFRTARWDEGVEPHESGPIMTLPLLVLAFFSLTAGGVNTPFQQSLEHFLEPVFEGVAMPHLPEGVTPWALAVASATIALIGIGAAALRYWRREAPAEDSASWRWVRNGYYVDDLYGNTIVLPGKLAAAWLAFVFDQKVIDGAVNGIGSVTRSVAASMRPVQSGYVRQYAVILTGGAVALLAYFLIRGAVG